MFIEKEEERECGKEDLEVPELSKSVQIETGADKAYNEM